MLNWIEAHSTALNVITNLAMLAVWFVYLHLILMAYLRQRKPRILINRGAGVGLNAHCLVSNMSQEPIYVNSILAVLKTEDRSWMLAVTDVESLENQDDRPTGTSATNQGPLCRGDYMDIGTLGDLVRRTREKTDLANSDDHPATVFKTFELIVVAAHGSETLAIGAKRTFRFNPSPDADCIYPDTVETRQISSPWERRRVHKLLKQHL
jgi:hypothetical protein